MICKHPWTDSTKAVGAPVEAAEGVVVAEGLARGVYVGVLILDSSSWLGCGRYLRL